MTEIPELTEERMKRAIPVRLRKRLMDGRFDSGEDIAALRRFVGVSRRDSDHVAAVLEVHPRDHSL